VPPFVTGLPVGSGPSLWRRGLEWTERVPVELSIDAHQSDRTTLRAVEREAARQAMARRGEPLELDQDLDNDLDGDWVECRSCMGGPPLFWQPWTTLLEPQWRFFFQLDGAEGWDGDPYALNFAGGGGSGYAFLSADGREGRFLWDCV
jgi:hypothetical protein